MTVTQRKPQHLPDEIQTVNEPGVQYQCDACACDLTHTVRIKCADPACCDSEEGVDICPRFAKHKRGHAYRVIEMNSYPIFTEDWGADEELLLITGIASQGIGNWKKIAEHVGTRTRDEVEAHYNAVYVDSPDWPLPRMDLEFNVDPEEFQARKRRRIASMNTEPPPPPKIAPTSAPGVHEIATFLPGRLEFEHELDNDAEDLVKDLEFGVVLDYGGDQIVEDENDLDVRARLKWEEERRAGKSAPVREMSSPAGKGPMPKTEDVVMANGTGSDEESEEPTQPPPLETNESLALKLTLLEMYAQRVEKRLEAKAIMFERGLLEYKKMQAADKKRAREEREILQRLRPFARLQTAEDYEAFAADILYEAILRKRIQELQHYRRLGLSTPADIEKYEVDLAKRTQSKAVPVRDYTSDRLQQRGRQSSGPDARRNSLVPYGESEDRRSREPTPRLAPTAGPSTGPPVRRPPAPLNLANSPSLHLLTPAEQTLCSQLRIFPKPYLVIKETLVREYARRGGKLRRREARDLVKIDVNKTSRVWDFLVQAGFLKITTDMTVAAASSSQQPQTQTSSQDASASGGLSASSVNGSPSKISTPPRPPLAAPALSSASSSVNGSLYSTSLQSVPTGWPPH
ncbi:hypothetical protein BDQ17DRAFT_1346596 [Cyathus striatus]|nr:hypothetical protein BDQ17DRAFT_1346596 [Cyathus striatus]